MFHTHDGWYFKREGSDVVLLRGEDFETRVETGKNPVEVVRFDAGTWASVMASMSAQGETAETFMEAVRFFGAASTPNSI